MQFIDYVKIHVKAGDGGRGCVSFRREKFVPHGGPDGGDGGRGGHVILKATSRMNTLLDFKYKKEYRAKRGMHGMGKNMHGKDGDDLILPVPIGTVVKDALTNEILSDLVVEDQQIIVAKGGKGGLGNAHFATPVRQTPRFAQPGEKGEERWLILELKLLADVGLIGMPNAGKSTLLSVISSAKPKIADYPFTTLSPVLGVVKYGEYKSFVVADIPGLIEGAHKGAGLGFQFLRHIERTSILAHLIDVSEFAKFDAVESLLKINKELELYNSSLIKKPQVIVGTKIDISGKKENIESLKKYCEKNKLDCFFISAITGIGIKPLIKFLSEHVEKLKKT